MDIFKLYRYFWDYSFENPEKIKPNDVAIYSFAVEHCNRLGWKKKFNFPTSMAMEAVGIKSYSVFKKHLDNLIECGLIEIIEFSKNQYSSNVIALKENYKANSKADDKALDKALLKHASKQARITDKSIVSIIKQVYNYTNKQIDEEQARALKSIISDTISIDKDEKKSDDPVSEETVKTENEKSYDRFNEWIDKNIPYIRKIKNQITYAEYCRLTEKYNGDQIRKVLTDLSNYKDAPKRYVSVNLTFQNWAKKEYGNG